MAIIRLFNSLFFFTLTSTGLDFNDGTLGRGLFTVITEWTTWKKPHLTNTRHSFDAWKKTNMVWNGSLPVELALSWMDFIGTVSLNGCSPTSKDERWCYSRVVSRKSQRKVPFFFFFFLLYSAVITVYYFKSFNCLDFSHGRFGDTCGVRGIRMCSVILRQTLQGWPNQNKAKKSINNWHNRRWMLLVWGSSRWNQPLPKNHTKTGFNSMQISMIISSKLQIAAIRSNTLEYICKMIFDP